MAYPTNPASRRFRYLDVWWSWERGANTPDMWTTSGRAGELIVNRGHVKNEYMSAYLRLDENDEAETLMEPRVEDWLWA